MAGLVDMNKGGGIFHSNEIYQIPVIHSQIPEIHSKSYVIT